ncbi:MAG TPA: ECF-type sigma factor [Gemmataceae bacterium]|nr:ECF-type sigma factor [Gemmataceae bacterium]
MEEITQFRALLRRCLAGSQEAAMELCETFSPYARQTVRETLRPALRRKCDSDDIVQAMWLSFFHEVLQHCRPESPEEMIRLLRRMARNHTIDFCRKFGQGSGRDFTRERSLECPAARRLVEGMVSKELPPDHVAELQDDLAQMLAHVESERDCQIVQMVCAGCTNDKIAAHLGVCTRTVERALVRLAREYLREQGCDCPTDDAEGESWDEE